MSFAKPTFKQDILTDIFGSSLGNDKSTTFTPQKTVSDMVDLILPWNADHECFRSTDQTFSEKLNNGGSVKQYNTLKYQKYIISCNLDLIIFI